MAMKQPRLSINSGLLCDQRKGRKPCTSPLIQSLWDEAEGQRQKILRTCFVKGIADGTLKPTVFAGFMVQDSLFCQMFQQSIVIAASKAQDQVVKTFLQEEAKVYETYYKKLWQQLNISCSDGIELKKAIKSYADYQQSVAKDKDPIYFIFAMIATLKIWQWIGEQLREWDHGLYCEWFRENFNPDNTKCQQLEDFIGARELLGSFDKDEASRVFSSCMSGECNFFESLA